MEISKSHWDYWTCSSKGYYKFFWGMGGVGKGGEDFLFLPLGKGERSNHVIKVNVITPMKWMIVD